MKVVCVNHSSFDWIIHVIFNVRFMPQWLRYYNTYPDGYWEIKTSVLNCPHKEMKPKQNRNCFVSVSFLLCGQL